MPVFSFDPFGQLVAVDGRPPAPVEVTISSGPSYFPLREGDPPGERLRPSGSSIREERSRQAAEAIVEAALVREARLREAIAEALEERHRTEPRENAIDAVGNPIHDMPLRNETVWQWRARVGR
jgi:hypothetical protein